MHLSTYSTANGYGHLGRGFWAKAVINTGFTVLVIAWKLARKLDLNRRTKPM